MTTRIVSSIMSSCLNACMSLYSFGSVRKCECTSIKPTKEIQNTQSSIGRKGEKKKF